MTQQEELKEALEEVMAITKRLNEIFACYDLEALSKVLLDDHTKGNVK